MAGHELTFTGFVANFAGKLHIIYCAFIRFYSAESMQVENGYIYVIINGGRQVFTFLIFVEFSIGYRFKDVY